MTNYAEAVRKLLPEIRARRAEIEQARRMPADLAEALRATGIFRLGIPKAIGGEELPLADLVRIIETIAAADGSTGWVAMIGMSGGVSAGYMSEQAAKEIYADPSTPTASLAGPIGKAERVDGGLRVTGRWAFASGITHCEWIWLGCIVHENGAPKMTPHGPEIVHVSMPISQGTIHDTWHVSGLAGTGSNDFSCENVLVPDLHVWSLFDPSGHRDEALYRYPGVSLFVSHVAAVALGIARGALDELVEIAQTKMPTMSMAAVADRPVAQVELARAEAKLGAARALLYDAVEDIWQTVSAERKPSERAVAMNRIAAIHAAETAVEVTRTANVLAGGSAIYTSSPMQRFMRDAEALGHHFTVSPHTWEDAGRVLLGRAPLAPIF